MHVVETILVLADRVSCEAENFREAIGKICSTAITVFVDESKQIPPRTGDQLTEAEFTLCFPQLDNRSDLPMILLSPATRKKRVVVSFSPLRFQRLPHRVFGRPLRSSTQRA